MRRTLYDEFQSLDEMEKQGGPRPGFAHNPAFVRDGIRLPMHAVEQSKVEQSKVEQSSRPRSGDEEPFQYRRRAQLL